MYQQCKNYIDAYESVHSDAGGRNAGESSDSAGSVVGMLEACGTDLAQALLEMWSMAGTSSAAAVDFTPTPVPRVHDPITAEGMALEA